MWGQICDIVNEYHTEVVTVELCWELNKEGFDLPLERLNAEECAQTLYEALKV